jgi:hypothetical protein
MHLLILLPPIMPENDFNRLKIRRQELQNQLTAIQEKLAESETFFETQSFFHDPEVVISLYKNKKKPDQWLGRVRVPDEILPYFKINDGKRFYISFFICDVAQFPDRHDLELHNLAKQSAKNKIKQRFSNIPVNSK